MEPMMAKLKGLGPSTKEMAVNYNPFYVTPDFGDFYRIGQLFETPIFCNQKLKATQRRKIIETNVDRFAKARVELKSRTGKETKQFIVLSTVLGEASFIQAQDRTIYWQPNIPVY